jgi:hypothetical protein
MDFFPSFQELRNRSTLSGRISLYKQYFIFPEWWHSPQQTSYVTIRQYLGTRGNMQAHYMSQSSKLYWTTNFGKLEGRYHLQRHSVQMKCRTLFTPLSSYSGKNSYFGIFVYKWIYNSQTVNWYIRNKNTLFPGHMLRLLTHHHQASNSLQQSHIVRICLII